MFGDLLEKVRGTVGRKLMALILTPILTSALVALNAALPAGNQLSPEQITNVVEYIIALAGTFIFAQGTVDALKAKIEAAAKAAQTPAPAPVTNTGTPDMG
jgi:hypothetical protein